MTPIELWELFVVPVIGFMLAEGLKYHPEVMPVRHSLEWQEPESYTQLFPNLSSMSIIENRAAFACRSRPEPQSHKFVRLFCVRQVSES